MGKLTPKPNVPDPLFSWEILDIWLQNAFKSNGSHPKSMSIEIDRFDMTVEEMISEGTRAGYKVTRTSDNTLTFE